MFENDIEFFEKAKRSLEIAQGIKNQVDKLRRLARDIDVFESSLLTAIVSDATEEGKQLDLPEIDSQASREYVLESLNMIMKKAIKIFSEAPEDLKL